MNRRSAVRALLGAGASSIVQRFAAAQQDPGYVIHSEVRLVLLDVRVRNHSGEVVPGLTRENFTVFEDGRPQQITEFGHEDLPVTIGLLVDESRSMAPKRPSVLTAALTFIDESNPQDEVFVLNFNDTVSAGLPPPLLFSGDREQLRAALFRGESQGRTALYDAVVDGLDQLEMGQRAKKALVLISDGGDNCSIHNRRQTFERIERSIATVHTVGLFDLDDADKDPGLLKQLAKISGGEAYFPESGKEMIPVCRSIAHDIRTRYTIGYRPPPGKPGRGLRHVRVRVSAPGHPSLSVLTRTSYRYDESEAPKKK